MRRRVRRAAGAPRSTKMDAGGQWLSGWSFSFAAQNQQARGQISNRHPPASVRKRILRQPERCGKNTAITARAKELKLIAHSSRSAFITQHSPLVSMARRRVGARLLLLAQLHTSVTRHPPLARRRRGRDCNSTTSCKRRPPARLRHAAARLHTHKAVSRSRTSRRAPARRRPRATASSTSGRATRSVILGGPSRRRRVWVATLRENGTTRGLQESAAQTNQISRHFSLNHVDRRDT